MPHKNNKRRSTQEKHQKGETDAKNAQENKQWKDYKGKKGKLSVICLEKEGYDQEVISHFLLIVKAEREVRLRVPC